VASRRRWGAGNVRKLPSGKWQARRRENGSLVHIGTFFTKTDAERALVLAEAEALRGTRPLGPTGTVAEWGRGGSTTGNGAGGRPH